MGRRALRRSQIPSKFLGNLCKHRPCPVRMRPPPPSAPGSRGTPSSCPCGHRQIPRVYSPGIFPGHILRDSGPGFQHGPAPKCIAQCCLPSRCPPPCCWPAPAPARQKELPAGVAREPPFRHNMPRVPLARTKHHRALCRAAPCRAVLRQAELPAAALCHAVLRCALTSQSAGRAACQSPLHVGTRWARRRRAPAPLQARRQEGGARQVQIEQGWAPAA